MRIDYPDINLLIFTIYKNRIMFIGMVYSVFNLSLFLNIRFFENILLFCLVIGQVMSPYGSIFINGTKIIKLIDNQQSIAQINSLSFVFKFKGQCILRLYYAIYQQICQLSQYNYLVGIVFNQHLLYPCVQINL